MSEEHLEYGEWYTFSSGIRAIVLPFPSLRFDKFAKQGKKKFPLPKPPKKKIKVVDGTETIDDLKDEKYLEKKEIAEEQQNRWLSEKILKVCLRDCIEIDLDLYADIIEALEEDNEEPYPENPLLKKVEFLTEYVIRSATDFTSLTRIATQLMRVDETEVSETLETFPGDLERSSDSELETSGLNKNERLEVQPDT